MNSLRCKLQVKFELSRLGLSFECMDYGRINIHDRLSGDQLSEVREALCRAGLDMIEDKKGILIEKIKHIIIEMVHHSDDPIKTNFSHYLSAKLNHDYTYLANIFSEVQGTTIENFIIQNKIYKVKMLIGHKDMNLTEISVKMHYSSVAHLSTQFKKVTGVTPSQFKQFGQSN